MSDSLELSRKLVSIYDALDHNQPKNALKLLKPILSRPNPPSIAVALSALAQVRSGRPDTAVELVRSLAEGGSPPTDEVTLQTCLAVVKLLGPSPPLHLIVTLYRNALQACTGHPEWNVRGGPLPPEALATGLYFSYLRTRDFPKMQQIGLRLHNSFGKQVKFLNWAIIPMLLQGDSKLIGLAENLLNRVEFKGNSQSVMLMIRCLKMQGKIIEAWDLVETCLEESLDKAELKIELAYSLEAQERYHFARKLIEEGKDDWKIIEILISSVIQLDNEKQSLLVEELLMNKREESRRSFTLGLLHFFKRLKNWEKFESLMSAFAMEFGKKPSFMDDCKGVLSGLEESWHPHVKELFIRLFTDLLKSSKLHEYPFFVNVAFAVSEGSLDTFSLFSTFASYLTSQEFLKLAPSEDGRFDSWIFVLIEQLLSLDEGLYALETCFLALYLLSMRQFSVDAKLYAIRLLCHKNVGCIQKAVEIFRSLDVKLVLLESVNHLILEDALRFGKTDIVNALCYDLLDFHSNYHKDAPDMTILCYKEDNLIQAVEFIEFKSKMESSLNKRYAESIQRFNKIIDFDSIEDILSLNESLANLSVQEEQLHLLSDFKAVSCRLETHSKYFNLPSLHLSKFTNHIGCEETFDSRQDGIIKQIKLYEILTQLIFLILNGEVSSLVNSLNHLSNHLSFFGIQNNLVEKTCDAAPEDVIWSFLTAMLKLATDFLLVNEEVECHNVEVSRDISSITTRLNEVSTRLRPLLELWLNLKERICQNASVDEFRISKSVSEIVTMTHLTTRLNLRILALISSTLNGSILLSRKNLIKKLRKLGLSQDEMDSLIPVYLRLKEEFSSFVQGILLAAENIRDTLYRLVTRPFADIKFHSSIFQEENVRAYSITTYYAMIECQRNSIRDVNYSLAKAIEKLKLHK